MPKKDCGDVQEWCETEFSTYCAKTKTGQKIGTCQKKRGGQPLDAEFQKMAERF